MSTQKTKHIHLKCKTHQRDAALVYETHYHDYLIIAKTYQRDGVGERDEQRDKFLKLLNFCGASRRFSRHYHNTLQQMKTPHISRWWMDSDAIFASVVASLVSSIIALAFTLVCFALNKMGGGPRVVVSTAAFHARVRFPVSAVWKKQKCFFPNHVWKSVLWGASVTER